MRSHKSGCYRYLGMVSVVCAVLAVGCNHREQPQPSKPGMMQGKEMPGQVVPQDKADKCRPEGKIITCVEGVCDPETGDCVECVRGSDCKAPEKPVCSGKKCVPCDAAHDCESGKCDVSTGKCVACLTDADCMFRERGVCCRACVPLVMRRIARRLAMRLRGNAACLCSCRALAEIAARRRR
ncbi:MAG: hypothetical protein II180_09715 [Proteobacteria bacterium]|nr:hypothetical protein [Pseudomonadota bacterium]